MCRSAENPKAAAAARDPANRAGRARRILGPALAGLMVLGLGRAADAAGTAQAWAGLHPGTGTAASCAPEPAPAGTYGLVPFVTGFDSRTYSYGNINFACSGASAPAFAADGSSYFVSSPDGYVYRFGPNGGAVGAPLSTLGPTLSSPVLGLDGRLYATRAATTGDFRTGAILEIDPVSGAQRRIVAANLTCPLNMAVDPLSGDLFATGGCFGAGGDDPSLWRVHDPAGAATVSVYATLPGTPNGELAFAPDGTLYVDVGYTGAGQIYVVSGTDRPMPPTVAALAGIVSRFAVRIGETNADGSARSLLVRRTGDLLEAVEIADPAAGTALGHNVWPHAAGPDGYRYVGGGTAEYRLVPDTIFADGFDRPG
jgi:hypothetical protein